jgi:hypothetical protein
MRGIHQHARRDGRAGNAHSLHVSLLVCAGIQSQIRARRNHGYNPLMSQQHRTLFSWLLEQPWWISALAGVAFFGIALAIFEPVAPWVALPFFVIAGVVGWKQLRTVAPGEVDERLKALRDMPWEKFSAVMRAAYTREGYAVSEARAATHDFVLEKDRRQWLLACRKWKAHQLGIAAVEDLARAIGKAEASGGICVATGEVNAKARQFAERNSVRLVTGTELARLVGRLPK